MDVNGLISHINRLNESDFQQLLEKLKDLQPLQDALEQIPEPDRIVTLNRIQTFVERDSIIMRKVSSRVYEPRFSRFDFVDCYFTGMGFEWDGKHIALIWDIDPNMDSVMVIPTTSKKRYPSKSNLNVGAVKGLYGGETTLLFRDMTRVSRKRLVPLNPYYHPKKKVNLPVRLTTSYSDQILWGVVTNYANEITFEETLKFNTGIAMVSDLIILKNERFKAVRSVYDNTENILEYRTWNKDNNQRIKLITPRIQIPKETKMRLIDDLFSEDENTRVHAEAHYYDWYHSK